MRFTLLLPLIWLCTFTARAQDQPSFQYQPLEMDGWTVLIQDKLEAEPELLGPVTRLLRVKLWEISTRLPAPVVARLQEVPIRMHLDREGCPGGVYHPSEDWLRDHQFPTDWARGVEFGNARNFLSWTRSQPFPSRRSATPGPSSKSSTSPAAQNGPTPSTTKWSSSPR
jgi:hypothetical protein